VNSTAAQSSSHQLQRVGPASAHAHSGSRLTVVATQCTTPPEEARTVGFRRLSAFGSRAPLFQSAAPCCAGRSFRLGRLRAKLQRRHSEGQESMHEALHGTQARSGPALNRRTLPAGMRVQSPSCAPFFQQARCRSSSAPPASIQSSRWSKHCPSDSCMRETRMNMSMETSCETPASRGGAGRRATTM
jgi:hypothetical protein